MDGNASRVIGTAALISVGVGTLNSFWKDKKPPSMRFLIGSGAAYVILSAIGEAEPEVAKALAVAMAVTVTLGDGGGVLSYISKGEIDTKKKNPNSAAEDGAPLVSSADLYEGAEVASFTPDEEDEGHSDSSQWLYPSSVAKIQPQVFVRDSLTPIPGI